MHEGVGEKTVEFLIALKYREYMFYDYLQEYWILILRLVIRIMQNKISLEDERKRRGRKKKVQLFVGVSKDKTYTVLRKVSLQKTMASLEFCSMFYLTAKLSRYSDKCSMY